MQNTFEAGAKRNSSIVNPNAIQTGLVKELAAFESRELDRANNRQLPAEITGTDLLLMNIQKMECFIEPFLPKVGLASLAGQSDVGKSMLLRQLAMECVTGNSFLGFQLNALHRSAIFAATEDDQTATAYLVRKQLGIGQKDLSNLRFIFDSYNLIEVLHESLTNKPADLVIVDCFQDSYGGDLKDTQKIRIFLHKYQELAKLHQCLILFLHHTAKRTESYEPSKNNLLSGQGFEAKMRLVMELRADQANPNFRHLCIVKGNYLPGSFKKESFVLSFSEETFTFSNTGERTPFELLVKQAEDSSKSKYNQAKELKEAGYGYEQIAQQLGYQSKGSVSKLFKKGEENGW